MIVNGRQSGPNRKFERMAENERAVRQFLQMLQSAGVTHLPRVVLPKPKPKGPQRLNARRGTPAAETSARQPATRQSPSLLQAPVAVPEKFAATDELLAKHFDTADQKHAGLCQLADVVAGCQRCSELADTRKQTVFGVGNPDAEIMFIGEAPGADEDREGEPFVGAAGQLLNKIIAACGLQREEIYICNILRCRPPGNRNPKPQEAANCREFLDGQIRIIDPDYIICWGTVAAQNLLGETRSVGKMRGTFMQHGRAKVLCTYHPSYLLRNPSAKKLVWDDMKLFMKERGVDLG